MFEIAGEQQRGRSANLNPRLATALLVHAEAIRDLETYAMIRTSTGVVGRNTHWDSDEKGAAWQIAKT